MTQCIYIFSLVFPQSQLHMHLQTIQNIVKWLNLGAIHTKKKFHSMTTEWLYLPDIRLTRA